MKAFAKFSTLALYMHTLSQAINLHQEEPSDNGLLRRIEKLEQRTNDTFEKFDLNLKRFADKVADSISKNTADIKIIQAEIKKNTDDIATNSEDITDINMNESDTTTDVVDTVDTVDNAGECIEDHNTLTGEYCGEWVGATIKKLPLWGDQEREIDFEWPTQTMWDAMSPDTKLASIEFSSQRRFGMQSAQVTLTNGEQSQQFGSNSPTHFHRERIDFDPNESIGKVRYDGNTSYLYNLQFYDRSGVEIEDYSKPYYQGTINYSDSYQLNDNEELIGIYGSILEDSIIQSFGYIVKEKKSE